MTKDCLAAVSHVQRFPAIRPMDKAACVSLRNVLYHCKHPEPRVLLLLMMIFCYLFAFFFFFFLRAMSF